MAKDWSKEIRKIEGAVMANELVNPYGDGISCPSPSVNFTYGNTWLLPCGFTEVVWGPPKGGKSLLQWLKIGQLHQDDPEALAVIFDIEMRARVQLTPAMMAKCKIDPKRLLIFQSNQPEKVFDLFEQTIGDLVLKDGMRIKYVVMDSLSSVRGRRGVNADTVNKQQIGDQALTIKDGLSRILETQRNAGIALSIIVQQRAEMDADQVARGFKTKMAASWALEHFCEYFVYVGPNEFKKGRQTLLGEDMVDKDLKDLGGSDGHAERTGHKIQVTMRDSSLGPKWRTGEFAWSYEKGIVNVHEEVFLLGSRRGVIEQPSSGYYLIDDKKYHGAPAALKALKDNPSLQAAIIKELKLRDVRGDYEVVDAENAKLMQEEAQETE